MTELYICTSDLPGFLNVWFSCITYESKGDSIYYIHIFISVVANIHSMYEVNLLLLLLLPAKESFIYAYCFYKLNADIISCTLQLKLAKKEKNLKLEISAVDMPFL